MTGSLAEPASDTPNFELGFVCPIPTLPALVT